jgi:hypothetical protein
LRNSDLIIFKLLIMKKVLFLLLLVTMAAGSMAQGTKKALTVSSADDTLVDAQTGYLTTTLNGSYGVVSFQLKVTKVSGTVAGTATLEGSHDGVTYASIHGTSYTITNVASQSAIWTIVPSNVPYYRLKLVMSGTQSSIPTGTVVYRK